MIQEHYKKNYEKQVKHVRRIIQKKCDAEDIVQDAYVKAISIIHKFDPNRGKFESWFWMILVNTLSVYYKNFKRDPTINYDLDSLLSLYSDTEKVEKDCSLISAIRKIKNQHHCSALYHYYVLGSSYDEVEEFTGMSEAAFKKMTQRSLPILREALK